MVHVAGNRLAHLQQADGLERLAGQTRFLERLAPDEVLVDEIGNRDGDRWTAGRNRRRRWQFELGWRRRGRRRGVQHDIDRAVRGPVYRELAFEGNEPVALASHAI